MERPLVALKRASKSFVDGKENHQVLEGVDFALETGSSVALTGASGSGKSTLLNMIAGFEPLSSGELWLDGDNTNLWKDPHWSLVPPSKTRRDLPAVQPINAPECKTEHRLPTAFESTTME